MNSNLQQENLDLDNRYEDFTQKGYFDISEGFPFETSQELFEVLYNKMFMGDQNISRLPIVATDEGIFIQTKPSPNGEMQHSSLVEIKGIDPEKIIFTTGIEAFSFVRPTGGMFIKVPFTFNGMPKTAYWEIKKSSDHFDKPLVKDQAYIDKMKSLFEGIAGVEFYY